MNLWDTLPSDIQLNIQKQNAILTLQKNFRRLPALRSKILAKACLDRWGGVDIISPHTAYALEYCSIYSGTGDNLFWTDFCLKVLDSRIENIYSSDMGHGWIERCADAHNQLVNKYASCWCNHYNDTLLSVVQSALISYGITK
jgi:hypothetical protein